jgi:hypothetical protein
MRKKQPNTPAWRYFGTHQALEQGCIFLQLSKAISFGLPNLRKKILLGMKSEQKKFLLGMKSGPWTDLDGLGSSNP